MRQYQANVNVYMNINGTDIVADCTVFHWPGNYHAKPEDCYPEETEVHLNTITDIETSEFIWKAGDGIELTISEKEKETLEDKAAQLAFIEFEKTDIGCEFEW